MKVVNRIPEPHEYKSVQELVLDAPSPLITDEAVGALVRRCPQIERATLCGLGGALSDATVIALAGAAWHLKELDLSGCGALTDVALLELARRVHPLRALRLNGVRGLTDAAVAALAGSFPRLRVVELCGVPLLTAASVRDVWGFGRRLERVRLAGCRQLTDEAFPSDKWPVPGGDGEGGGGAGPLLLHAPAAKAEEEENEEGEGHAGPPPTWLDAMPPLLLTHPAHALTFVDVSYCARITDAAVAGLVAHAPRIRTLLLAGCARLTDAALASAARLGAHLDVLSAGGVRRVTDGGVLVLAGGCRRLVSVDLSGACVVFVCRRALTTTTSRGQGARG
jgi:F-box and leucine-rich repeat protein GRR1